MKKLLVIIGPTGTGKTNLAIQLAKKFNGEIVSADSRQVYIGMDIGTDKMPSNSEFRTFDTSSGRVFQSSKLKKGKGKWVIDSIPVHLYDLIAPDQTFSVAEYQQLAYKAIDKIHKKGKLPIIVGGTGLYVRAVIEGMKIPKTPPDKNLRKCLESQPLPPLVAELAKVDPETAEKIDKQNPRRVVRALEVYYQTGQPFSELKGKFKARFDNLQIGLTSSRDYLYKRVDERVEGWFRQGFVEEVEILLKKKYNENLPAMSSLGYRQVIMFLQNKLTIQEAKQRIKWDNHAYIRRQQTWFRKMSRVIWFDIQEKNFKQEIAWEVGRWLV